MPGPITFSQVDGDGEMDFALQIVFPNPIFYYYGTPTGTTFSQPGINSVNIGGFAFNPNPGDREAGLVFIIESTPGFVIPGYGRFFHGSITTPQNPMHTVLLQNSIGELYNGRGTGFADEVLTVDAWSDPFGGSVVFPPQIISPFPALQVIVPSPTLPFPPLGVDGAINYSALSPPGAYPVRVAGNFYGDDDYLGGSIVNPTPPVVDNFDPNPGTAIKSTTLISFDVTDDLNAFRLVMLIADFPRLGIREVIHDGDSFGPQYQEAGNARVAITNGWRYTVRRQQGWPASPTIIPYAIDTSGNENA